MEFLPLTMNGKDVYAGFGPRFGASIIDSMILIPVTLLSMWLKHQDLFGAILLTPLFTLFFTLFHVHFNALYGATPGKMALGIKVVKPDGTAIGWGAACKRQAVFFVFSVVFMFEQLWGFAQMDSATYASLSWSEQATWMGEFRPDWFYIVTLLQWVWMLSEIIVFFSNKRRRAAHDFIAGTVVIHKHFASKMGMTNKMAENEGKNRLQA